MKPAGDQPEPPVAHVGDRGRQRDLVGLYLAGVAPGSRRTLRQALDWCARCLAGPEATAAGISWHRLGREEITRVHRRIIESYAPATANKMLSALRGVLRTARTQGLLNETEAWRLLAALPSVTRPPRASRAAEPTLEHVKSLYAVCAAEPSLPGRRDAALLTLLAGAGLDRGEAAALTVVDYKAARGWLQVRSERAGRTRTIPLGPQARQALADWLALRGWAAEPLLLPIDKAGTLCQRALTDQAIYDILRRLARRAGVPHVTARGLRGLFLRRLEEAGLTRDEVDRLAGFVRGNPHDDTPLSERSPRIDAVPDVPYRPPTSGGPP